MQNNNSIKRTSKVPMFTVIIVLFIVAITIALGSDNENSNSDSKASTKIENCLHDVLECLDELVYDIFN